LTAPEKIRGKESSPDLCKERHSHEWEARKIPVSLHIDLMKRDLGSKIEFQTLMWFEWLDSIIAFMGEDFSLGQCARQRTRRAQPFRRAPYAFQGD
jgi:hypothetical protein